jgi:RNA polymerase sigma-70 factor (ECF subfamily)
LSKDNPSGIHGDRTTGLALRIDPAPPILTEESRGAAAFLRIHSRRTDQQAEEISMPEPRECRDNAVITRMLMRHRARLFAYILACVRNFDDAEEVFQEVAVTVVSSFDKLREESGFLPWAREIARRHVLSHFRKSTRDLTYDSELVAVLAKTADRIDGLTTQDHRAEALANCLDQLPTRSRRVLQMRYGSANHNVDDIAKFLGSSMVATYGVLKRIRISLRACVEKRLSAEENL